MEGFWVIPTAYKGSQRMHLEIYYQSLYYPYQLYVFTRVRNE